MARQASIMGTSLPAAVHQALRCPLQHASAVCSAARIERQLASPARRDILIAIATTGVTIASRPFSAWADELDGEQSTPARGPIDQTRYQHLSEPILAYEFDYPITTTSGRAIPLVVARRPERYSSAAPLTADARQRIVCELVDLIDAVTISVSVGPPAGTLKSTPQGAWKARQVAEQVLIDRSTARVTSGQRVSLNSVEEATADEKDGITYYIYEHVSQGSPTLRSASRETYRHALAVTATRPGLDGSPYLYTINFSCPQELWPDIEQGFRTAAASFTLPKTGPDYVAPDQDPWRFF